MNISIRPALPGDVRVIVAILREAADWVHANGGQMWTDEELDPGRTLCDIEAGLFHLAEVDGEPAGTIRFQLTDPEFWPDIDPSESAFVHRVAVRRAYAGRGVSTAMLAWARDRARGLGRRWLRLDCDADRPRLRAFYERFGFRRHDERQVGPWFVTRYALDVRGDDGSPEDPTAPDLTVDPGPNTLVG